jgi:hypothetical protein
VENNRLSGRDVAPTHLMYVDNPQFAAQSANASAKDSTVTSGEFFAQLRAALTANLSDGSERSTILARLDTLEKAKGYTFLRHYSTFIAGAAHHMAVVSPFVPGLTSILTRA